MPNLPDLDWQPMLLVKVTREPFTGTCCAFMQQWHSDSRPISRPWWCRFQLRLPMNALHPLDVLLIADLIPLNSAPQIADLRCPC